MKPTFHRMKRTFQQMKRTFQRLEQRHHCMLTILVDCFKSYL